MAAHENFRIQASAIVTSPSQLANPSQLAHADAEDRNPGIFAPGEIVVSHGQVAHVGPKSGAPADLVLEGYAIIPGLVNSHTHLEFSDLEQPLPAGAHFPAWIESVMAARQTRGVQSESASLAAIDRGLCESHRHGVFTLADVVSPPWQPGWLNELDSSPCIWDTWPQALQMQFGYQAWERAWEHFVHPSPLVIACLEQLGLTAERAQTATDWREMQLTWELDDYPAQLHSMALSPHAPYSTEPSLFEDAIRRASREERLAVMHLAESPAEREWVDGGTGPFVPFHAGLGLAAVPRNPRLIEQWIHGMAQCPRALAIHGNYLNDVELDLIARYRDRLSVVYCPRTHRHFQHAPYPLEAMHRRGIRVLLGTDSRSTNPDLNLWQEARLALQMHPGLKPTDAFAAITDQAAEALGIADVAGSLRVGRSAFLAVLPIEGSIVATENIQDIVGRWIASDAHPIPLA